MLGVLKAGGVCVPLNPEHSPERLKKMITTTAAVIILTRSEYVPRLSSFDKDIVAVDTLGPYSQLLGGTLDSLSPDHERFSRSRQSPFPTDKPCQKVTPKNAAFVIFTSGSSTGIPKGVVLEHRNICTSAEAHGNALSIGPSSRVFQFAAYTFDISIQDHFTTLTRGGCICVPSEHDVSDQRVVSLEPSIVGKFHEASAILWLYTA